MKKQHLLAELESLLWDEEEGYALKIRSGELDDAKAEKLIQLLGEISDSLTPDELLIWRGAGNVSWLVQSLNKIAQTNDEVRAQKAEDLIDRLMRSIS